MSEDVPIRLLRFPREVKLSTGNYVKYAAYYNYGETCGETWTDSDVFSSILNIPNADSICIQHPLGSHEVQIRVFNAAAPEVYSQISCPFNPGETLRYGESIAEFKQLNVDGYYIERGHLLENPSNRHIFISMLDDLRIHCSIATSRGKFPGVININIRDGKILFFSDGRYRPIYFMFSKRAI